MRKIISAVLAIVMVLSLSVSVMAEGVAPVTGESNIKCTTENVEVKTRTLKVTYENANFDSADDVTFLFYAPESAESDNIIETNIYHADQVDYSADGYTFKLSNDVPAGTYNLLIGGTDEDVPCLVKGIVLGAAAVKGDLNDDQQVLTADLTKLARYLASFDDVVAEFESNSTLAVAADVNQDDDVTVADLTKLARYLAGFDGVDLNDAN